MNIGKTITNETNERKLAGWMRQNLAEKIVDFIRAVSEWRDDISYPDVASHNDRDRECMCDAQWERLRWIVFCL